VAHEGAIERLDHTRWAPPWTMREHHARYEFANRFVRGKTVVDCACGDGTSTAMFAETATRVLGFDSSKEATDAAQERSNAVISCADATALPVESHSVDLFISLETIEHVDDYAAFLDEITRVLRDDGMLICSTPDRDVYSPGNDLLSKPWNQFHFREWTVCELSALLRQRFQEVTMLGQNQDLPHTTRLKCWLGRRLSTRLILRMNQAAKIPRFIWERPGKHDIVNRKRGRRYEYSVAICRGVKRPNS